MLRHLRPQGSAIRVLATVFLAGGHTTAGVTMPTVGVFPTLRWTGHRLGLGSHAPVIWKADMRGITRSACGLDSPTPGEAFLSSLVDWERQGVPPGAGAASGDAVFNMGRMRMLLAALGNPQRAMPVVHIAGTKGKGSVAVMLAAILRAAGYRTGLYTSPHLLHLRERIHTPSSSSSSAATTTTSNPGAGQSSSWSAAAAGQPIGLETLEQLVQEARPVVLALQEQLGAMGGGRLTHFEVSTALALRHFADATADVAVVEVGLGGSMDATNVFEPEQLVAAVITPIGKDHLSALGGSLPAVAAAKAGILKLGRPAVLAAQPHEEAASVVAACAAELGCPLVHAHKVTHIEAGALEVLPGPGGQCARQALHIRAQLPTISFADMAVVAPRAVNGIAPAVNTRSAQDRAQSLELEGVWLQLVGPHQRDNACVAVATAMLLRAQGWNIPDHAVRQGLEGAFLPGRIQVARPAVPGPYMILDGAHTAHSAAALVTTLRQAFPVAPVVLVVAMAADKEHVEVLRELCKLAPKVVIFTAVPIRGSTQRSAPPGMLAAQWQAAKMASPGQPPLRCRELIQASATAALQKACHELGAFEGDGVICITGSLHAAAAGLCDLQLLLQQP